MQDQDPALLEEFVVENSQNLQDFEQDLLSLEETGASAEVINKMFRAIHSMKGSSGYLGFNNILEVSHLGETLLDMVRKDQIGLTAEIVDVLLQTNDLLRSMVEAADFGESAETGGVLEILRAAIGGGEAASGGAESGGALGGQDVGASAAGGEAGASENIRREAIEILQFISTLEAGNDTRTTIEFELEMGKYPYWVCIAQERDEELRFALSDTGMLLGQERGGGALLLLTVIDLDMLKCSYELGDDELGLIDRELLAAALDGGISLKNINGGQVAGELSVEAAEVKRDLPAQAQKEVRKQVATENKTVVAADGCRDLGEDSSAKPAAKAKGAKTDDGAMIKINAHFLDELLRLTGNMVMSRNQLRTCYSFADDPAFATLSQAITEVHRSVVQTRMKAVSSLFDRFKRVVRDLSKQLGKSVELRTEGGEMELDRTILEAFVDPLMHMIRNSIDHGIEDEKERQRSAKPHTATIILKAYQESGEIIIAVCDDGRGIDIGRVKAKALEKGMITPVQAESMPDSQALMLIFEAGFSTAQQLSEVSGRGVGMDVVRTNIENIGGVLDCHSETGKGTTIQARLPLTKAMVASSLISALVVSVGEHRLCIPQSAVNELIRVSDDDRKKKIRVLQGQEVFQHRELVVPIIPLAEALGINSRFEDESLAEQSTNVLSAALKAQTLIVLQHRQNLVGMMVDEIIGIEEAVVRELPKLAAGSNVFGGHTVLGDGQVVMLVDIGGVVERMKMKFTHGIRRVESNLPALSVGKRSDRQTMIIFNYSENEHFAVPLELVSLVEKIKASDIHKVGDRSYYPIKNNTIPLLYLDKHLPISPIDPDLEYYNLILPARVKFPIGIITNTNISVHDISERFDSRITHDKGVLGTFMHEKKLVMLLDLYALFENDDPDHFDTGKKETCTPARILIVEDSLFYRKLNSTYLSGPDRKLTIVNDGREALTALRQNPEGYDLVVTDIEMPNMNGFELVKAVRGDPLLMELPVIALTALQDEASRARGVRLGFDEYVVKVDKDSLIRCVENYAQRIKKGQGRHVVAEVGGM